MKTEDLIINQPGKRGFTKHGIEFWLKNYNALEIRNGAIPRMLIPPGNLSFCATAAILRSKTWLSSTPFNSNIDLTGLASELALWKYMGLSAKEAMALFLGGLNSGDPSYDLKVDTLMIDMKGTITREGIYTLSQKSVRQSLANVYAFAHVTYRNESAVVDLEGWSLKTDAREWMRLYNTRFKLRLWVLKRNGVLHPMQELKRLVTQASTGGE